MNHIYRLVRRRNGAIVAVSELTKVRGKGSTRSRMLSEIAALSIAMSASVQAGPTGGSVVAGTAQVAQTGTATTIQQSSQNAIIDWQTFDIGANESVRFLQPGASSIALNRVLGGDASQIMGNLSANGKVFLINPNGVLFGKGSQVNVGGFVASTRDISNEDFLDGRFDFNGTSAASILNAGSIDADGGYVALLGANVSNEGVIAAKLGSVVLASGDAFTLDVAGDGLLNVTVNSGAVNALASNGGLIRANGGQVLLTAKSAGGLLQSAVNNSGVIQAQTIENRGGVIKLLGDMQTGTVSVGGFLDASAPAGGDGGFVDTSAAHVALAPEARVTTLAAMGRTGNWLIDPVDFTIAASGGDMTGTQLSANLGSSNVTILSSSGASGVNGDIHVNDTVTWSANKLTLNAYRNVNINTTLNGSGTASLAIEYGQGAVAASNTAQFTARAPVNLPAGNNFSTKLGSDGAVANYTVITTLGSAGSTTGTDLQGIDGNPVANYALGANIDASSTSAWNSGQGFSPIGNGATQFNGIFDGLGHVVSGLYINRSGSNNQGLFGAVNNSTFRNVGVTNAAVTGNTYVGPLVANCFVCTYSYVYSTGSSSGASWVGGLVGLGNGSYMSNAYSTANVTGSSQLVGGLFGQVRFFGTVDNSYATGTVTGGSATYVGGFAGQARYVTLTNTYATGNVSGGWGVGGLVGLLDGATINTSYSSGAVSGSGSLGGLVGTLAQTTAVNNSYWNTTTSGRATSSGGTGLTNAQMQSAANFTGFDFTNQWTIFETQTQPLLRTLLTPLTITANSASKTYDGNAYTGGAGVTYSQTPNMSHLTGTLAYTGGTNAGSYTITPSGLSSSTSQQGYVITYVAGTLTINPFAVNLTGSRAYNGSANVTAGSLAMGALVNSETLSLTGTGSVASKDVGNGKTITLGTLALSNGTGLASNYTFTGGAQTIDITPATLTATAVAANKVYDGTTGATATLTPISGLVGSETLSITGTGTFNSKDVASANLVTVNSVSIGNGTNGGLGSNYTLATGQTASANITPVTLSASASATSKVYDGNVTATATLGLSGFVGSETVTASNTATFNSKDVLTANLVTVNSVSLSNGTNGGLASNYSLSSGQTASASITPVTLTATASASSKVYDGNVTAAATLGSLVGLIGSETVGATAAATFNSKDVTTANLVTVNSVSLSNGTNGGLASNYTLAAGQTTSASITPTLLSATATAASKAYDGNTTATATLGLTGFIGSETVTASNTATFNSKDVLTANLVTVNTVLLANGANGGLASNYSLASGQTASASITPVMLTATASASNKVYDGTVTASATLGSFVGLIGSETVGATATATFNSKDVLTASLVTVNSVLLANGTNGGLASNYSLASGQTASASITPVTLTATASASNKAYDGNVTAVATLGSLAGLIGGETVGATATATFNSKDATTANLVTVNSVSLSNGINGGLASNYTLGSGQTASANITPKALTATASATNKVYDGTTIASASLGSITGLVGSETVGTTATATFNTKDVATANLVTINGATLSNGTNGGLASNYSLASGQTAVAAITPKALTAAASATNKIYDGNAVATATLTGLSGLIGSETVTASNTATFNSKDVLTANLVTVNSVLLSDGANGGLASNYSLAGGQTASAIVTPKALSATASATNKVYDGTVTAAVTLSGLTGLIGAESLGVSALGTFNSKNVATANLVTVNSAALSDGANGGLASNYSLGSGQTAAASITPRALSATATAYDKTYDGTVTAAASLNGLSGLIGNESLTTSVSGFFNSKDVAIANVVTINSIALSDGANGGLASNYSLVSGQTAAARITPKTITVVGDVAHDKIYDGNRIASTSGGSLLGVVAGDTVTLNEAGTFATANAGNDIAVTTSHSINGADAANYSLVQPSGLSANIKPLVEAAHLPNASPNEALQNAIGERVEPVSTIVVHRIDDLNLTIFGGDAIPADAPAGDAEERRRRR